MRGLPVTGTPSESPPRPPVTGTPPGSPAPADRGAGGRRRIALLGAVAVVAIVAGLLAAVTVGPRPARLPADAADAATGDAALAATARQALGGAGHRGVAVVLVERPAAGAEAAVTTTGLGDAGVGGPAVTADTPFEIGSITKVLTGLLLADAVERGEVRLDERVGDLVPGTPLAGAPAGDVTLEELATHRSGLPRLPLGIPQLGRSLLANLTGGDPYTADVAAVFAAAAAVDPADGRGEYAYSNLGMAVLGHAVAARAGVPYRQLLSDRLLDPLGMDATVVIGSADELPAGRASGTAPGGDARAPWISDGYAPAGVGIWSTATDMARLATATLDGTVPGASALEPVQDIGDDRRIGLAWQVSAERGTTVTWHNGGTGGFRSFLGLDRDAGRAVVMLGNTAASVDSAALTVLVPAGSDDGSGGGGGDTSGATGSVAYTLVLLLLLVAGPVTLLVSALRVGRRFGLADRLGLAGGTAQALAGLALGHSLVDWLTVPPAVWAVAAALTAAGVAAGILAWRRLPVAAGRHPGWRWASTAVGVLLSLGIVALFAVPPG